MRAHEKRRDSPQLGVGRRPPLLPALGADEQRDGVDALLHYLCTLARTWSPSLYTCGSCACARRHACFNTLQPCGTPCTSTSISPVSCVRPLAPLPIFLPEVVGKDIAPIPRNKKCSRSINNCRTSYYIAIHHAALHYNAGRSVDVHPSLEQLRSTLAPDLDHHSTQGAQES